MCCGNIAEDRTAFRATFVYIILYTTADNTGYTNATYTIRTIETHLCRKLIIMHYTYISAKYVF